MSSRNPRRIWTLLLIGTVLLAAGPAAAQETEEAGSLDEPAAAEGLGDDPKAIEAYRLIFDEGRMIQAREIGEELLASDPNSYAGHFIVGYVLHWAETNLPLSFYHTKKALEILDKEYSIEPTEVTKPYRPLPDDGPWLWHAKALEELAYLAGEMDRHQERIDYHVAHDALYVPKAPASRAWPLMRLRRYTEARQAAEDGLAIDDPWQKSVAWTALCVIESELQAREESHELCLGAVEYDKEAGYNGPNTFHNAHLTALGLLRLDEAERLLLEGTKYFDEYNAANSWESLVWLYLAEGRFAEALDAVREMFSWYYSQSPFLEEQLRAQMESTSALFLLATGRGSEAARLTRRTVAQPDRTGFVSSEKEQNAAATAVIDSVASRTAAELKAEEASWSGWTGWLEARWEVRRLRWRSWSSSRRAAAMLHDDRMLHSTLRPYLAGSINLPEWMEGELCRVLGPGVIREALEEARQAEDFDGATAYFDALEAEALWLQGDSAAALETSRKALEGLPQGEALLQARVAAVGAQAALEEGAQGQAVELFSRVMQQDAGLMRRLGLALPCSIVGDGGAVGETAAGLLRGSPRFLESSGPGFSVRSSGAEKSGEICLQGPHGEVLVCATVTPRAEEGPDEVARRLVAEFHREAFSPKVDLTQADMRSLDGYTLARNARQLTGVLENLLGDDEEPDEPN